MGFKINKVKADLRSYPPFLIMGEAKVGKTTLFRDLVLLNYKNPAKGLLISLGQEEGYHSLDDLNYEEAQEWTALEDENGNRGLVEIIDEVLETESDKENKIEMVCLDTLDELVTLATHQVFEEHREATGSYPKSLNDALGGYSRGKERVVFLIREQIARLRKAKIAVFILAHTKVKAKNDVYSDINYEVITNNLDSTFYTPISSMAQMLVNIVYKRQFGDITEKKKKQKNGAELVEQVGNLVSSQRMMVFCDDTFVDAGGRFTGLPKELPLSAENFMKAFEQGVRNSSKASPEEIQERFKQEEIENNAIAEQQAEQLRLNKKIQVVDEIKVFIKADQLKSMKILKPLVTKYKMTGFDNDSLNAVEYENLVEMKEKLEREF